MLDNHVNHHERRVLCNQTLCSGSAWACILFQDEFVVKEWLVATSHQCTLSILSGEFRPIQPQWILTSRNGGIFYFLKCLLSLHVGAPLTASLPAVIASSVIQLSMDSKQNSEFLLTTDCWYSGVLYSLSMQSSHTSFFIQCQHRCNFGSGAFLWIFTGLIVCCNAVQSSYVSDVHHCQNVQKHFSRRYLKCYTPSQNDINHISVFKQIAYKRLVH